MSKKEKEGYFREQGLVKKALGNGFFTINIKTDQTIKAQAKNDGKDVLCKLSGNIRKNNIKILEGDVVDIDISVHDTEKGLIVFRYR